MCVGDWSSDVCSSDLKKQTCAMAPRPRMRAYIPKHLFPLLLMFCIPVASVSSKTPTRTSLILLGSIPGLGESPGEGKGYQLQYFGLENSMDSAVHGVAKSRTQLSNFHFTSQWIKICLPTRGTCVLSLVPEDPKYPRATKPMSHHYQVHPLDPRGCNY